VHPASVVAVDFGPGGKTVLTVSGTEFRRWDRVTGKPEEARLTSERTLTAVVLGRDGKAVFTGTDDGRGRLWDVAATPAKAEAGSGGFRHGSAYGAAAFDRSGRWVATGSLDQTARVWDAATGVPGGPSLPHPHYVRSVALSTAGRVLLSGCQD